MAKKNHLFSAAHWTVSRDRFYEFAIHAFTCQLKLIKSAVCNALLYRMWNFHVLMFGVDHMVVIPVRRVVKFLGCYFHRFLWLTASYVIQSVVQGVVLMLYRQEGAAGGGWNGCEIGDE